MCVWGALTGPWVCRAPVRCPPPPFPPHTHTLLECGRQAPPRATSACLLSSPCVGMGGREEKGHGGKEGSRPPLPAPCPPLPRTHLLPPPPCQDILADMRISREVQDALESPAFDRTGLPGVVRSAWALHGQLQQLTPGTLSCISAHLLHLRVVGVEKCGECVGNAPLIPVWYIRLVGVCISKK